MEVKIIVTLVSEAYAGRAVEMNLHTFWVTALASSSDDHILAVVPLVGGWMGFSVVLNILVKREILHLQIV